MARPATNYEARKAEIVAAAINSFATYGYEGTSNKTIAKEGGFKSPALIYHYFPGGKAELFNACVENFRPLLDFKETATAGLDAPPEIYLRKLARDYLNMIYDERSMKFIRMVLTEAPRFPELVEILPQKLAPAIMIPFISYLERQAATGRIKVKPSLALVMQFFGPLFIRGFFDQSGMAKNLPIPIPDHAALIESHVQTFLHGILCHETAGSLSGE